MLIVLYCEDYSFEMLDHKCNLLRLCKHNKSNGQKIITPGHEQTSIKAILLISQPRAFPQKLLTSKNLWISLK